MALDASIKVSVKTVPCEAWNGISWLAQDVVLLLVNLAVTC